MVPASRAREAALVDGVEVIGVETLHEAVDILAGRREVPPLAEQEPDGGVAAAFDPPDLADVRGHDALLPGDRRRGSRRPQPLPPRPARHGQDDARAPDPVDPAAAQPAPRRSRSRGSTRSPACTRAAGSSRRGRSARRTTPSRRPASSAAARSRRPARSRSPTTGCCSSTSCRSSRGRRSRRCASRSRTAAS